MPHTDPPPNPTDPHQAEARELHGVFAAILLETLVAADGPGAVRARLRDMTCLEIRNTLAVAVALLRHLGWTHFDELIEAGETA